MCAKKKDEAKEQPKEEVVEQPTVEQYNAMLVDEVNRLRVVNADRLALLQSLTATLNGIEADLVGRLNNLKSVISELNEGIAARNAAANAPDIPSDGE